MEKHRKRRAATSQSVRPSRKQATSTGSGASPTATSWTINAPSEWDLLIEKLVPLLTITSQTTTSTAAVILVCGARNVGKSSFCRRLLNRALEASATARFLECDVGQSEFTPPSLMSLHDVSEPVLGPPHTHLRQALSCRFFGDVTPGMQPAQYVGCIASLLKEHHRTHDGASCPSPPLIINTCGWISGLGGQLLADIIAAANPSHLVMLDGPAGRTHPDRPHAAFDTAVENGTQLVWLPPLPSGSSGGGSVATGFGGRAAEELDEMLEGEQMTPPDVHVLDMPAVSSGILESDENEDRRLDAPSTAATAADEDSPVPTAPPTSLEARSLQLLSYFGVLPPGVLRLPGHQDGFADARWQRALAAFLSTPPLAVPLSSLQLIVPDASDMSTCGKSDGATTERLAHCLNASIVGLLCSADGEHAEEHTQDRQRDLASCECVGLALVRHVDVKSATLFVSTPTAPEQLCRVDTLVRSSLELPIALLQPTALTKASPFLASGVVRAGGSQQMRSRNNILRGART